MSGKRQQAGLIAAALAVHLLLLAAIPPVAASLNAEAPALRIRIALPPPVSPEAEAPVSPVETGQAPSAQHERTTAAGSRGLPRPSVPELSESRVETETQPAQVAATVPVEPTAQESPALETPAPAASRVVGLRPAASTGSTDGLRLPPGNGSAAGTVPASAPAGNASGDAGVTGEGSGAPGPAIDTDKLLRDYSSGVVSRIRAQQRYPAGAERAGVEGKVKLSFTLAADGSLVSSSVADSSGSDELDGAALAALKAAAPFAAIPAELERSSARLSVTLNFYLK